MAGLQVVKDVKQIIVGLFGGIASGKSAFAEILRHKNAYIINADTVYKDLIKEGGQLKKLQAEFSDCFDCGALNWSRLREQTFNCTKKLELLNSITHPPIITRIKELIAKSTAETIVLEIPLPNVAKELESFYDITVCVISSLDRRMERILQRGIDKKTAQKIIAVQVLDEDLIKQCDYAVYNDGDLADLKEKAEEFFKTILNAKGKKDC